MKTTKEVRAWLKHEYSKQCEDKSVLDLIADVDQLEEALESAMLYIHEEVGGYDIEAEEATGIRKALTGGGSKEIV